MKTNKHMLALIAVVLAIFGGCSEENSPAPLLQTEGPTHFGEVNDLIAALPAWQQPSDFRTSGTASSETITQWAEPIPDYLCDIREHDWARASNEIFAPEQDFAVVWPGAMLHGQSYQFGNVVPVDLPRSSVTIFSNMPGSQSIKVDDPNSVSMNDAINQMRGGVDPGAYQSEWEFRVEEVYSNAQSMMEMGVSAGYGSQIAGALNFSEERTVTRHVIFGRAIQRMYTIEFADDVKDSPAHFFDATVTAEDLADAGIDNGNVPVYVKSVTYGEMVMFRAIVTIDGNSNQFKADFKAAWEGFTAGGGGGGGGSDLLKQATYEAAGYGGDPGQSGSAIEAVSKQEFGKFFDGATVQNAVPLFFEVVTLKDGGEANLGQRVIYETWENCKGVKEYRFEVEWKRARANGPVSWDRTYEVDVLCGLLPTPRDIMTKVMDFPNGNTWYNVNKSGYCTAKPRPNEKIQVQYGIPSQILVSGGGRLEYPFVDVPRNEKLPVEVTPIEVKATINPLSATRKVTLELFAKLIPVYE